MPKGLSGHDRPACSSRFTRSDPQRASQRILVRQIPNLPHCSRRKEGSRRIAGQATDGQWAKITSSTPISSEVGVVFFGGMPPTGQEPRLRDILEPHPPAKYTLTDHLWKYLQDYAAKHKAAGNGFGFGMAKLDGVTRTLSARYYKDGSEILIPQPGKNPRRLTPREAARLMGFEDHRPIVVSDTQAYRQISQSSCPLVAEAVGKQLVKALAWQLGRLPSGTLLKRARGTGACA